MAAARSLGLWWVWVGLGTCHQGLQLGEQGHPARSPDTHLLQVMGVTDAVGDGRGFGEASARSL